MKKNNRVQKRSSFGKALVLSFFATIGLLGVLSISSAAYAINVTPPGASGPSTTPPTGAEQCDFPGAASDDPTKCTKLDNPSPKPKYWCGNGAGAVYMTIDIGCDHNATNAITDAVFAIIRFLTLGVGLVVVASTVYAGIQYSLARDDPNAVGAAKKRIASNLEALLIFIFAYAILNYLVPSFLH